MASVADLVQNGSHEEQESHSDFLLPFGFARRFGVLLERNDHSKNGAFRLFHKQPLDLRTISEIQRHLGATPEFVQIPRNEFEKRLQSAYSGNNSDSKAIAEDLGGTADLESLVETVPEDGDLLEQEDNAPVVKFINALLAEALRANASDIHIETFERYVQIRFRVDGVLREIVTPKKALAPMIVSRIKVMAKLDIAEKRVPQDGRTSLRIGGRELDIRVSVLPTGDGERVVLRLLDKDASRLDLRSLGMNSHILEQVQKLVRSAHGIFLVTGPTGSGKTTTLYASLSELSTDTQNVMTVEDPIEYNLDNISQTQVNTKTGMSFAKGLRAILRQDPDIVMVGEIRDLETAEIAIQASLTGHLVLSTLHTNTAIGSISRLVDMGLESYLLSTSLLGVLAQRLVRVLCEHCKEPYESSSFEREILGLPLGSTIYTSVGCSKCGRSGYSGRTGIYELILMDEKLQQMIHDRASEPEMLLHAHEFSKNIRSDGAEKVLSGLTSVSEVVRLTLDH